MRFLLPLPEVDDALEMHLEDIYDTTGITINHLVAGLIENIHRKRIEIEQTIIQEVALETVVWGLQGHSDMFDEELDVLVILCTEVLESLLKLYERVLKIQHPEEVWCVINTTPYAFHVQSRKPDHVCRHFCHVRLPSPPYTDEGSRLFPRGEDVLCQPIPTSVRQYGKRKRSHRHT